MIPDGQNDRDAFGRAGRPSQRRQHLADSPNARTTSLIRATGWALATILALGMSYGSSLAASIRSDVQYDAETAVYASIDGRAAVGDARMRALITKVLAETSEVWADLLPQQKNVDYAPPQLVLYDGAKYSACGPTFTAIGPFYCPLDRKIYLDAAFFASVKAKLGGAGDVAYTFLLAHEVGHHVQNELGILRQAQAVRRSAFGTRDNPVSIRVELMADCFAGVWAASAETKYHLIVSDDVAKLDATAQAIGDDRLEQAAQGIVVAATFTHGTSAQRAYWFEHGLASGKIDACNTFER